MECYIKIQLNYFIIYYIIKAGHINNVYLYTFLDLEIWFMKQQPNKIGMSYKSIPLDIDFIIVAINQIAHTLEGDDSFVDLHLALLHFSK